MMCGLNWLKACFTAHVSRAAEDNDSPSEHELAAFSEINQTLKELNITGEAEAETMKLASFLGHTFSTEMLLNILPEPLQKSFNNILVVLFEQGVFKCASKQTKVSGAKIDKSMLICNCKSNSTDGLASVAGVWKCESMCFYNEKVIEVAYRQLRSKQKQQLHKMCAKFLEKKAYRCNKCATKTNGTLDKTEIYFTTGLSKHREEFLAKVDSILKEDRAGCRCECAQLLETVLIPIVEHYKAAEEASWTFHYLLECAAVCASLSQKLRAMQYLKEAKIILKNLKEEKATFKSEDPNPVYICELDQAVMYRLTGEILFNTGNIMKAKKNFNESLKLLKCNVSSNGVTGSLKAIYEKIQKFTYRSRKYDMAEEKKLKYLHEKIACLSFLWQIHHMYGQSESESLAIKMQSNLATQSTDGYEMILNAIDIVHHSQFVNKNACKYLKPWLYRTCSRLPDCAETRKLISHLLRTMAMVQLCSGNLKQSIDFTLRAEELGGLGLDARAIGILHLPLLLTGRYKESMELIKKLERVGKEMSSTVADGWFYAGCLNFLLYTGFKVKRFEECLAFVYRCESDANMVSDKSLIMHLYSSIALWYARLKLWEKFAVFYDKAFEVCKQLPASIHSLSGMAAFLECSVLLFKKELSNLSQDWKKIYKKTLQFFEDFRNHFGGAHIFVPRVLHLNAFLYQLVGKNILRNIFLHDALELYKNQGSLLDHSHTKQSQAMWSCECIPLGNKEQEKKEEGEEACCQIPSSCSTENVSTVQQSQTYSQNNPRRPCRSPDLGSTESLGDLELANALQQQLKAEKKEASEFVFASTVQKSLCYASERLGEIARGGKP